MPTRHVSPLRGLALSALAVLTAGGCVDSFGGSAINVTFDPEVQTPAPDPLPGDALPGFGRPPANTYYAFNAVQILRDEDGTVLDSFAYEVQRFEIRPLIRISSPCFIEHPERPYPGLHVTQEANRLRLDYGIPDEFNPPADADEGHITDILTSQTRIGLLPALQNTVKAVTSFSDALPAGVDPNYPIASACVEDDPNVDPNSIPPPDCMGDESNARRLAICQAYWNEFPTSYEGSDLVFTLPLNGRWAGAVTGTNPKNAGFLGGANFYPPVAMNEFDELVMTWQYKDRNGDGEPDYPPGIPESERGPIGVRYMSGTPIHKTRGVVNVPLAHPVFPLTGEAAIFPALGEDNVHF
jgi:hypothetical protein